MLPNLQKNRHGTHDLRITIGKRVIKRSLGAKEPARAKLAAIAFTWARLMDLKRPFTDVTESRFPGKVYLSSMIDCFDGVVVRWSISTRPEAELVNTALDAAVESVSSTNGRPVVHSDRCAH